MTWLTVQNICNHNLILSRFMTYHRFYDKSNTIGVTSGAGIASPSGALEITSVFVIFGCSIFNFLFSVFFLDYCPFVLRFNYYCEIELYF
jgi:hypothetical protein